MAGLTLCTGCIYFRGPAPPTTAAADVKAPATATSPATLNGAASDHGSASVGTAPAAGSTVPPAELATIMGEVQQLGTLDPAAQNALLDDMKKTDPSLWPQLVQTFRASVAYHKEIESEEYVHLAAQQSGIVQPAAYNDSPAAGNIGPQKLPAGDDGIVSPKSAPAEFASNYPDTHLPEVHLPAATPDDWRTQLASTIQALEAHTGNAGAANSSAVTTPLTPADQATLRMLYLAAGRHDDAVKPISNADEATQEFWNEELFGLATALDEQHMPDVQLRNAEAAQHLRDAAARLGQSGKLMARNLAFCTEVLSYGIYKPFPKNEFKPGQEVVLYAEVENFSSDNSDKGYHTALKCNYQLLDSRGAQVAEQEYPTTEEWCKNPRRDFFVRYFLYLPNRIDSGNYTLQLTVEDTLGNKTAQSSIPFTIVGAD